MASFYEKTFGWKTELLGPEMGDYVLVTTAESDVKPGAPAGAINGGFFPKRPWPAQYPSVVIGVDDIESAMRQGKRAPRYSVSQCKFPASAATFHSSIPRGTASACCSPIVREPHEHGRLSPFRPVLASRAFDVRFGSLRGQFMLRKPCQ